MAVLTATKNQWRTKSESRFSSALDGARMPETANRDPRRFVKIESSSAEYKN
jgi:hypothetical protein